MWEEPCGYTSVTFVVIQQGPSRQLWVTLTQQRKRDKWLEQVEGQTAEGVRLWGKGGISTEGEACVS